MSWIAPSIGFVVVSGLIGITTKLALRGLPPRQLFFWAAIAYAATGLIALGTGAGFSLVMPGAALAMLSGGLAAAGLWVRFVALQSGEVSKVIPVTATYPAVSVAAAALLLGEGITQLRLLGTACVVGGIAILGQP